MEETNYLLIATAAVIAIASPGPATLAIAGTSMGQGRLSGLMLAAGIFTGSLFWSLSAAFGLAALLYTNAWLFEMLRYVGAFYLLYLAYKSAKSVLAPTNNTIAPQGHLPFASTYIKGLLIHLTNPKAIFFFGSLYTLGVPENAGPQQLIPVISFVAAIGACIFFGYAILFSNNTARAMYTKCQSLFDCLFAVFFGIAGIKLLASKVSA